MTTYKLGLPSEVRDGLKGVLPRGSDNYQPAVLVSPRDRRERRCPVYEADHYEVQAFYTTGNAASLDALEEALRAVPGVYATTQVRRTGDSILAGNMFTNPEWPAPLGTARRGRHDLRPQVMALIRDPKPDPEG